VGIRKWDPLRDLLALQESMNRLFEDSLVRGRPEADGPGGGWVPAADVYETDTAFVVSLDLPGVAQEDVEVRVDGGELLLRGERRLGGVRPESFQRMERSYGPVCRSFAFPEEVDPARVTAQFRDGLLRLELPKARSGAPRRRREGGEET
jgi:HSP20 family protein